VIVLEGRQTKSRKSRHVPLDRDAYDVLAPLRSDAGGLDATGSVWGGVNDIDTAFRCAVTRAGLNTTDLTQRVTFHTLRHTFASHFAQRTGDLVKLQQILGHASIRTTQETYAHFAPDHVLGSTAVLEGLGRADFNARSTHGPVEGKAVLTGSVEASPQVCENARA
jgi:integrase